MKSVLEQFNEVFDVQSDKFKQGKEEGALCLPCASDHPEYLQGYSVGYELAQKRRG